MRAPLRERENRARSALIHIRVYARARARLLHYWTKHSRVTRLWEWETYTTYPWSSSIRGRVAGRHEPFAIRLFDAACARIDFSKSPLKLLWLAYGGESSGCGRKKGIESTCLSTPSHTPGAAFVVRLEKGCQDAVFGRGLEYFYLIRYCFLRGRMELV